MNVQQFLIILKARLPLFIAALGLMMVLMVAQIDLSATSIMAMGCVVGASIMTNEGGYLAGQPWAPAVAIVAIPGYMAAGVPPAVALQD